MVVLENFEENNDSLVEVASRVIQCNCFDIQC